MVVIATFFPEGDDANEIGRRCACHRFFASESCHEGIFGAHTQIEHVLAGDNTQDIFQNHNYAQNTVPNSVPQTGEDD